MIPKPANITLSDGAFEIKPTTQIRVSADARDFGSYLQELLQPATGYSLVTKKASNLALRPDEILLTTLGAELVLGDEGYELAVTPKGVVIRAPKPAGLFYGVQTLRQLLPVDIESRITVADVAWTVPALTIEDKPRFTWRGVLLDVARHMFPLDFIKRYVDLLAIIKMNVLHLHLTDDQGWRIEIKKHPKLTEIGAIREASPGPYGGFYTQQELGDLVSYAASRFVTIVPEIEMPGHSLAALASYPELGCTGGPYKVRTEWGIEKDVYCAGNEKVYTFLEEVLTAVLELFPSRFIHIGGDEVPKDRWEQCPKCQAMIKQHGLKDSHELQSYFVKRIETFLNANERRLIGWDEILEGGLAPNATVMSWRGMEDGIKAARDGHDVIMSPMSHCYFDYYQSQDTEKEPPAIGGFLPLDKVYAFEPLPGELSPDQAEHVLGAQGNVWTEYIAMPQHVEYMTFPRACVLAEVVWSTPGSRDYQDFMNRLGNLLQRLRRLEVNFRDPFSNHKELIRKGQQLHG